jgi:hypothetical protein
LDGSVARKKINQKIFLEMSVEELYVLDVLEEASAAKHEILPKKSKLRYQK